MALSRILLSSLLLGGNVHAAGKHGIVGFGIPLYEDLCCQACHDSLASLSLSCTTPPEHHSDMGDMGDMMGMEIMGETSDECRATDKAWLETMAYCIQQNCNADGYSTDRQAECFCALAVAGAATPTFQESLPETPPTVELAEDAMWLNVTSLVNRAVYNRTLGTYGEFGREEYLHTKYSLILYLVAIGVIVASGILAQTTALIPTFQKAVQSSKLYSKIQAALFLPALFRRHRLEPLPCRIGYVPSRILTVFLFLLVALNIIFSSVSFGTYQPNIWFMSAQFETAEYVGNRAGTLSLVNMSIAILFAARNNLLIALTGWSQTTFITLHRWTSRVAVVQAIVHSIAYTAAYFQPGYEGASAYAAKASEPFYWWGIIATIALSLAAAVALLPLRLRFYESFLLLHIALVILALVGCWYHLVPHFGFDYGYQVWLYLCFAFWSADRLARLVRVAVYNPLGGSKAILEKVGNCDHIVQVTIFPRTTRGFGPAQHSFLYLGGVGKFWESHPFSVAGWATGKRTPTTPPTGDGNGGSSPPETHEKGLAVLQHAQVRADGDRPHIKFMIRTHDGMTTRLRQRIANSVSAEVSVYTEGPYAGHRATVAPLLSADTIVCIAGGIGITHVLGFLQLFYETVGGGGGINKGAVRAKRLVLAWSARERALIEHVRQNFLRDAHGAEYSFWCTGGSLDESDKAAAAPEGGDLIKTGRMDIKEVMRSSVEAGYQTAVLVCAPGGMADEVTKQVVRCVRDGFKVELVEEAFAW